MSNTNEQLITAVLIMSSIALFLIIIALVYGISAIRRRGIMTKKLDYLIEDITYKSEMLNSTVETVAKVANYVDMFEVVARKNMKSMTKVVARNKEDIYKIIDRVKRMATGESKEDERKRGK